MTTERMQFDFVSRGAREVQRDIERIGDQAQETSSDMEDTGKRGGSAFEGLKGGIGKAGGALAALGIGIASVSAAISKGLDAEEATAKMQAQLGLTKTEAKRIGGDAGKIYSQAYGESMDEVKQSITSVIRNMDGMKTASSADLQSTTKRAMDLASVMGEDVGPITVAVGQMMKTGLAKNSKEAFDILTVGAQQGANKADDLLDTMNEYGTQFRKVGIDGKTAMGLISQGLKAGARDADIVADAIKEFSIRAIDGSDSTADGFKQLGLDAQKMSQMIARGGPTASKGLDMVLDRIRKVKDPVKQAAIATELFGTQSEDLGKALFALDPSSAVKGLGQLAGATDRAGVALGDTAKARITAFKRTLEVGVTNFIGAKVLPAFTKLGDAIQGWAKSKDGQKTLTSLRNGLKQVGDWIRTKMIPALRDMGDWFRKKIWPTIERFNKEVLKELISQLKGIGKELTKSSIDWRGIAKVIGKVAEITYKALAPALTFLWKVVLKTLGLWVRLSIKSYELLYKAFMAGVNVVRKHGPTWLDWAKKVGRAVGAMKDVAVKAFIAVTKIWLTTVSALVTGAAKAFGWVPGLGGKLKKARDAVNAFKDAVNRDINRITAGKTVSIRVKALAGGVVDAGSAAARSAFGRATGGPIFGPGGPTSDDVPIWASAGEHMWTASEVQAVGGHEKMMRLRGLAKKGMLRYAQGGPIGMDVRASVSSPTPVFNRIFDGIGAILVRFATKMASMFGGATAVVRAARAMIGYPYSWGGGGKGGPSFGIGRGAGTYGFDCSGLTEYAWWKGAKVGIGGVTNPQWANSRPISGPRPGALAFPSGPSVHVMLGSDKPGYVIQAPFTGSYVQEVPRSSGNWRWPVGAKMYAGGAVKRAGDAYTQGLATMSEAKMARALGVAGRASGGSVLRDVPYLVGERGAEVFAPRTGGSVHRSGSNVVYQTNHFTIQATPGTDRVKLAREINDLLIEFKRKGGKVVTGNSP